MSDPGAREAGEAVEVLTAREQRFERVRATVGLVAGPLLFVALLLVSAAGAESRRRATRRDPRVGDRLVDHRGRADPGDVAARARRSRWCAASGRRREIFAGFGDPIVLLFLGGFVLASAMVSSGLDRRVAWSILSRPAVAASPTRILVAFALLAAVASAWMNNTSTTAMLFPIGLSVLGALARRGRAICR